MPPVEPAGNASLRLSISDPLSPIQVNAYTYWNADSGATAHMTPHRQDAAVHSFCIPQALFDNAFTNGHVRRLCTQTETDLEDP
jgi:hypothetical protein